MVAPKKFYFLAPTRDSPPDGPIVLGNIVASPSTPEDAINGTPPPSFYDPKAPYESWQSNWKSEKEKHISGSGGIWASFLQLLGVGGDFSVKISDSNKDIFEFRRLTTRYFVPNTKYVEACLKDEDVQDFLKKNKYREPLYMITGVKVAQGASVTREFMKERGLFAQFGIDLTAATGGMVPLQFGPKLDVSRGSSDKESSSEMSDFIFAFRLREIKFKRKEMTHEDYTKHALYSSDQVPEDAEADMEFEGLANEDQTVENLGSLEASSALDDEDGEVCSVIKLGDD